MNRKKTSKIKRLHLPLKKMTEREKNYVAVLLEDVNHNFKVFWEDLDNVKKDLANVKEDLANVKSDLNIVKRKTEVIFDEVGKIKERLTIIELDIKAIKKEIISIKKEIKEIKLSLSKKADLERLEALELRVAQIEKYLKLST